MRSEISTAQVNKYRRQIQDREDGLVPWDIALDIVCDTVIEQGKEIAKLRTALEGIAKGELTPVVVRKRAQKALGTPSGASAVAL